MGGKEEGKKEEKEKKGRENKQAIIKGGKETKKRGERRVWEINRRKKREKR